MNDENKNKQFAEIIQTDLAEGRVLELAEVYALDAVSEEERADIEEYISAAPLPLQRDFTVRLRQARETLATAFATSQVEPPPDLLAKILSALSASSAEAPDAALAAPVTDAPRAAEANVYSGTAPDSDADQLDEFSARRARKTQLHGPSTGRRWLIGAAAAALIAVGGVAVGSTVLSNQDPTHQILSASDVQTKKVDMPGGGTATLAISHAQDAAVVTMNSVSAPPSGKVYQMWLLPKNGTAPISQGTMDAEALSRAATIEGVDAAAAFAITVEPAGGSVSPTLPPVAAVPLNS
ncbi:anti-sigma factor [Paenarthrobacter sp. Z7-10]|uniref:anti-sigma factor n=1 Tax=Paenarthrobacter sp. Z7-10 TaxID=2787635 RepID=UPI0022A9CD51|nr:anti-sigma factor [Paenarthrobacter sp. Z7-10]MCZ2404602.1 anti-sigma factor [Paenarthrobacter sp. Z7-10]